MGIMEIGNGRRASLPEWENFSRPDGSRFGLSSGLVATYDPDMGSDPEILEVSLFDSYGVLREIEKEYGYSEGFLRLPTVYECHLAAAQSKKMEESIFGPVGSFTSHLILNSREPTKRSSDGCDEHAYTLVDYLTGERIPEGADYPRHLIIRGISESRKNEYEVRVKNHKIPFRPDNGRYDPIYIDQETGFLGMLDPEPDPEEECEKRKKAWFSTSVMGLSAVYVFMTGIHCDHSPHEKSGSVGLRLCYYALSSSGST